MFASVHHVIHEVPTFQLRGEQLTASPPPGIRNHQFYPSPDFSRATCLWEGPSLDAVRDYIDGTLGDSATQEYFVVTEEQATGLPVSQLV